MEGIGQWGVRKVGGISVKLESWMSGIIQVSTTIPSIYVTVGRVALIWNI
jgi:hypothetical protein